MEGVAAPQVRNLGVFISILLLFLIVSKHMGHYIKESEIFLVGSFPLLALRGLLLILRIKNYSTGSSSTASFSSMGAGS